MKPYCIDTFMLKHVGAVSTYCLLQLAIFWFCHLLALFWKTKFPFHARSLQNAHHIKYVHITCVAVGIIFPVIPVIAIMSQYAHGRSTSEVVKGGLGFGITRFPPLVCTGSHGDTIIYSLTLPIVILVMIGITILASLFWIFHRVRLNSSFLR